MREDGLAFVAVGRERREVLERAQAFMALLEGYAEHVMDAVGAEPARRTSTRCAPRWTRRRAERSGLLRVLERLIGLDLKLRQYEQGKAFCDGVVARGGIAALNRAWAGPDALPTPRRARRPAGVAGPHRPARPGPRRGLSALWRVLTADVEPVFGLSQAEPGSPLISSKPTCDLAQSPRPV